MKKIVSCLIIILSILTFSLTGCSNNNAESRISLTTENYHNWLSPNLYISDLQIIPSQGENTTYTLSCALNIETVKTADVQFENVSITYSFSKIEQWYYSDSQISTRIGYNGESHTSIALISRNRMIIDFPSPGLNLVEVADVSGYVLVPAGDTQ